MCIVYASCEEKSASSLLGVWMLHVCAELFHLPSILIVTALIVNLVQLWQLLDESCPE